MLTRNLPFNATDATALLRAKSTQDPRPPSYYEPRIDPALEAVIMRAIQRAPRDRYPSAEALLADLRDPAAALRRGPQPPPPPRRTGIRALRPLAKPALLLAALAGLGALIYVTGRHADRPTRPAVPAR